MASQIADRLIYTGGEPAGQTRDRWPLLASGEVVVSAEAARRGGHCRRGVGGTARDVWPNCRGGCWPAPICQAEFAALCRSAPAVTIGAHLTSPPVRRCRVSVSQAGYNTVLDILGAGPRGAGAVRRRARNRAADAGRVDGARRRRAGAERAVAGEPIAIKRAAVREPMPIEIDTDGAVNWRG